MARTAELTPEQSDFVVRMLARAIEANATQAQLASELGTSQQQISRLLKRTIQPTTAMARRAADAGYLRIQPLLDSDFYSADPTNPAPICLTADDVARLDQAMTLLGDILRRLQARP